MTDPDLMSGDGIYTLVWTDYPGAGVYEIAVHADDSEEMASVVGHADGRGDPLRALHQVPTCCGQRYEEEGLKAKATGPFRRSASAKAALVLDPPVGDVYPPGRVVDLQIQSLDGRGGGRGKMRATWTAPGNDYHRDAKSGVASYRLLFAEEPTELLSAEGKPSILLGFDRAGGAPSAGRPATVDFDFPRQDGRSYYVAVVGQDEVGNRGAMSNLVAVRAGFDDLLVEESLGEGDDSSLLSAFSGLADGDLDWIVLGAVAGVISVLLTLAVAMIALCLVGRARRKRRHREGDTEKPLGSEAGSATSSGRCAPASTTSSVVTNGGAAGCHDETDSSSFDSDLKAIPGLFQPSGHHQHHHMPHQLPGHAPSALIQSTYAPASLDPGRIPSAGGAAAVTPVYWSASQLLSKLERPRGSPPGGSLRDWASPAAVHGLSSSRRMASGSDMTPGVERPRGDIPDEYLITVGSDALLPRPAPPPVAPKPRNITQV
jgi:hypothetical protein